MKLSKFRYKLPPELIAQHPSANRDECRLMVVDRKTGTIEHKVFKDVIDYFDEKDVFVFNDTKVFPARLYGNKEKTGAEIEVFLLRELNRDLRIWDVLVDPARKIRIGNKLYFGEDDSLVAEVIDNTTSRGRTLRFLFDGEYDEFKKLLYGLGETPLPRTITRKVEPEDEERYQTIFARYEGAVAAPTAGLHFTPEVLAAIDAQGIGREELTLHVGAGTFKPVKSETIEGHEMHTEFISVRRSSIERIKNNLGKIIAVGTTSVRTLESLYYMGVTLASKPDATAEELIVKQWMPYEEANNKLTADEALQNILDYLDRRQADKLVTATRIIIAPGYAFKIVRGIVTNFHQPKSTLLLLISAFVKGDWKNIYDYALAHDFRFLSYGDSSLLL